MADVIMPSLGQTTTELTIMRWLKKEGDAVKEGDVLLEVETDKAVVEVEAYADGVLREILARDGAVVQAGSVIAVIQEDGEGSGDENASGDSVLPILATPSARALAREKGVDLKNVPGSAPGGAVRRADVHNWLKQQEEPVSEPSGPAPQAGVRKPLSRMRKIISKRLTDSKQRVPHYYLTVHIDASELVGLRERLRDNLEEKGATTVSYNALILKAAGRALKKTPEMNASIDGDHLIYHEAINIGLAVEVPDGLVVPVVRDVVSKDIWRLTAELKDVVDRARDGRLQAHEMAGGTFTVSNLGMFGIDEFAAIVNPPEAGILAVGRVAERPMVRDGHVAVGLGMSLTLSADHRIVDGACGGRFLRMIQDDLEHPYRLMMPAAGEGGNDK